MPFAQSAGARLHFELTDGPSADAPVLMLGNSLGTNFSMWDALMPELTRSVRVLRMDTQGHGQSDAPDRDYTIEMLARDAVAVMDAAGIAKVAYCGLSLGGMMGLWLGRHAPERLSHLIVCNSTARVPRPVWEDRVKATRKEGLAPLADATIKRWFTPGFLAANPPALQQIRADFLAQRAAGYAGCAAAIRDMDLSAILPEIRMPALIVTGTKDEGMPAAEHGDLIAASIPGALQVRVPASHIAPVELPGIVAELILDFVAAPARGAIARGTAVRRQVLGDAYVDRAVANRNSFNAEFQDLITRNAWAEIWTRPGLDHRTRRLVVLAITLANGRWEEFRLHLKAGLQQGGFTVEELKELLLQASIYAGVPAANTGFHHAEEILREMGLQPAQEKKP